MTTGKPITSHDLVSQRSYIPGAVDDAKVHEFRIAIHTKNPLQLQGFQAQGASVAAKLIRITNDPGYQKLSPERQAHVRSLVYDKYVVPVFQKTGHAVPDRDIWLQHTSPEHISSVNPGEYYKSNSIQAGQALFTDLGKGGNDIALMGAKLSKEVWMAMYGLGHILTPSGHENINEIQQKAHDNTVSKFIQHGVDSIQDGINGINFFTQTHPRDSMLASAAGWTGETISTLPVWEALGAARTGVGLTEKLATSKVGQYAMRRITTATDVFLGSLATGSTKKEAAGQAAGIATLGAAGEKIASYPLIKKWTANVIAMGGKPLAQAVAESVHGSAVGEVDTASAVKEAETAQKDPVYAGMRKAEKHSQNSISMQMFGKPLRNISHAKRAQVLQKRLELIGEAANELPVHVPDLVQAEAQSTVQREAASNPVLAKIDHDLKSMFGIDVADTVAANTVESVSKQTGITNEAAAGRKVRKSKETVYNDFPHEQGARVGAGPASFQSTDTKAYASHKVETIQAYKNGGGPRLAADGTKVGARSKLPWNEVLKRENTEQFIDTLRHLDGDKIKFEDNQHRLLFHWQNKDSMPPELKKRVLYELKKAEPDLSAKQFDIQARWQNVHLHQMAANGDLYSGSHVYRSGNYSGPTNWSEWQWQQQTEIQHSELRYIDKVLARHPAAKKGLKAAVQMLQEQRYSAKTPEEWMKYDSTISNLINQRIGGIKEY